MSDDNRRRGGRNRTNRRGSKNRTHKHRSAKKPQASRGQRQDRTDFWGEPADLPQPRRDLRVTDDAAAVPRSLGQPPLAGHEAIAEHYFAVVYDRAVQTAGALAAASGLLDPGES